ncbi:hypothetical protein CCUS01_13781 [Colletotrichum cuscutae]|uniref:Uncharacterized protein n=1 Tax=Colletotrichum cuscutae TaxID=1209917 RepID=A0AAI9YB41_9PEZI|nr:hypothetical protein CCUS01_13781 [Colletotrichum cuscutae]
MSSLTNHPATSTLQVQIQSTKTYRRIIQTMSTPRIIFPLRFCLRLGMLGLTAQRPLIAQVRDSALFPCRLPQNGNAKGHLLLRSPHSCHPVEEDNGLGSPDDGMRRALPIIVVAPFPPLKLRSYGAGLNNDDTTTCTLRSTLSRQFCTTEPEPQMTKGLDPCSRSSGMTGVPAWCSHFEASELHQVMSEARLTRYAATRLRS